MEPEHGWLEIWQKRAQENIKSLNNKNPTNLNCQILPYSQENETEDQLNDLDLDTDGWNILNSD